MEDAEGVTAQLAPVSFLPARVRETVPSNLTILIQDDLRIEVPAGFNPHFPQQVIQAS